MRSGRQRRAWRAVVAGVSWLAMAAPADGQAATRRWMRIVQGEVEVVGSADNESLRTVASQMAGVRDALTALVPATTRSKVPVTVLLDCEGRQPSTIVERPWRVYVIGRCGPGSGDEGEAAERYARIVLRRALHPLPFWLEVGVAAPAREVFSARQSSEIWQNRLRRAAFSAVARHASAAQFRLARTRWPEGSTDRLTSGGPALFLANGPCSFVCRRPHGRDSKDSLVILDGNPRIEALLPTQSRDPLHQTQIAQTLDVTKRTVVTRNHRATWSRCHAGGHSRSARVLHPYESLRRHAVEALGPHARAPRGGSA